MEEFRIDENTLEVFKHELKTHTRPIDKISEELKLFEGIDFSVDDLITEINCGIELRINYLKRINRDWEIEYNSLVDEEQKAKQKAKQKYYLDMTAGIISKLETLQRYLYKDYEIMDIGAEE